MPEKHTTVREGKRLLWYTAGLWKKAEQLTPFEIEVASIKELDENCWFGSTPPTLREVLGHRLCRAVLEGRMRVRAVQFPVMPEPDEIHDA